MLAALCVIAASYQTGLPFRVTFETDEVAVYHPREFLYVIQQRKGFPVSMFLLVGSEKALLIDAGSGISALKPIIERITKKEVIVALSHGHGDHTGNIHEFDAVHVNTSDSFMLMDYTGKVVNVEHGHMFHLGGLDVRVIRMIGHTPGSMGFLDVTHRALFTGDAIGSTSCWMHIAPLPLETMINVLRHIKEIRDEWVDIWPGHCHESNGPVGEPYVDAMLELAERIVYKKGDFESTEGPGCRIATRNGVEIRYNPRNLKCI